MIEFMITRSLCTLSKQAASTTRFAFQMRRVRSLHRILLAKLCPGFNSSRSVCEILERHLQLATKFCKKAVIHLAGIFDLGGFCKSQKSDSLVVEAVECCWEVQQLGSQSIEVTEYIGENDDTAPIITSTSAPDIRLVSFVRISGGRPTNARLLRCSIYWQLLSYDALRECLQAASEQIFSLVEARMRWQQLHAARGVVLLLIGSAHACTSTCEADKRARQTTAF